MLHRLYPLALLVALAAVPACGDDDAGDSASVDAAPVVEVDAAPPDAAANSVCYPSGIYGKCAESGCPMCLNGANIYAACSASCTDSSDCGDASELDGAQPLCAPLNPGAEQMICVLTCETTDQCPCGLECRASGVQGVNICAETL